jgi:3-methyl-2-oxobutanoate hydroxymethyltransferase
VTVGSPSRDPVSLATLREKHEQGEPLVMITAYDYPSAQIAEQADVDAVLVGDTAAEMTLGYASTARVSVEEMLVLTAAVRRGLRTPLLVGDLPFGSYEGSDEQAVHTAQRFVKDAGADLVKLEGAGTSVRRAAAIHDAGIPVIGHLGLTPQTEVALGGRRAQGRTAAAARHMRDSAIELEAAGCTAIVLEAVPGEVAALITDALAIPTIGIGAGAGASGQVLVWHDLLGLYDWRPRFAKAYANLRGQIGDAIQRYAEDVRCHRFPSQEHTYTTEPRELERLRAMLAEPAPPRNEIPSS